jgi:hypothetical protein
MHALQGVRMVIQVHERRALQCAILNDEGLITSATARAETETDETNIIDNTLYPPERIAGGGMGPSHCTPTAAPLPACDLSHAETATRTLVSIKGYVGLHSAARSSKNGRRTAGQLHPDYSNLARACSKLPPPGRRRRLQSSVNRKVPDPHYPPGQLHSVLESQISVSPYALGVGHAVIT